MIRSKRSSSSKTKKYVCRVRKNLIPDTGTTFILKTFLFNKIRHRFRNTWRPLDELFCQLTATGRGVPVPEIYGLYTLTDKFGLTRQAGIAMEDLAGFETLQSLFLNVDYSGRKKLLGTICSALTVTHDNGCHHVDLNLGSILVNPANYSDFRIIDFQHAKFFNSPNDESFLFMISHISKGIRPLFEESKNSDEIDRWIRKVAKTVLPLGDMDHINQRIAFYNSHDFRRKHREMIGTPGFAKLSRGVLEKAKFRGQR